MSRPKALFAVYKDGEFVTLLGNLVQDATTVGYVNPIAFDGSTISDQYRRSVVFTFIRDGKCASIDLDYYPGCEIRTVDESINSIDKSINSIDKSDKSIDKSDDFDLSALWRNSRSYFNEPMGTRPGETKDDGNIVDNCLYLLDPYTGEWRR